MNDKLTVHYKSLIIGLVAGVLLGSTVMRYIPGLASVADQRQAEVCAPAVAAVEKECSEASKADGQYIVELETIMKLNGINIPE